MSNGLSNQLKFDSIGGIFVASLFAIVFGNRFSYIYICVRARVYIYAIY